MKCHKFTLKGILINQEVINQPVTGLNLVTKGGDGLAKDIVNRSVSFNILDPDQRLLMEHADTRPNFSGYIKRLIQRDMDSNRLITVETKKEAPPKKIEWSFPK